jgi:transcriptional regulator with XRE-family HTH domain
MFSKKKFEELIAKSKMTPTEVAKKTKIQQTTISRLLTGNTTRPHPDTLDLLAKFFNVSTSYFLENISDETSKSNKNMDKFIKFNNTRDVLKYLMLKTGIINTTMLHKNTGVPMSSLNRILKGETEKSNIKTLQNLANYFNISLAQLRALEEIPSDKHFELNSIQKLLPLIDIKKITSWFNGDLKRQEIEKFLTTTKKILGEKSFAVLINTKDFEPDFKKNNIIIVDSSLNPEQHDFILASIKEKGPFIYQFNTPEKSIKILLRKCGEYDFLTLEKKDTTIFGVIVQEIRDFRG